MPIDEKLRCIRKELVDINPEHYSEDIRCRNCDGYGLYQYRGIQRTCALYTILSSYARRRKEAPHESREG
jgi:hypothetical protein